ncbi:serine/threonine-protein kinase [Actinomadura nitritigenes]|uniref:Serine/threonine protein kinase n=1 Tax=Actinomadura nitritigenes TaxID=134602 RepID=A0ABS3RAV5_9ACTN|nr:serine/threonine-protein kinase [Actinomadura nitritigenes]MBO2443353.1 serine/threonine protein kinase [Actinomadura nitritigenes]
MDGDIRPLEPADPRTVGGLTLLGRLGSGGMGTVYLGTDPVSGGRVAVKTIHPHLAGDESYRRRFKDEADLASRVASFCTARVLAHGEDDGRPYLVTDYVGGISLHQRLSSGGPLPPADLHGVAVGVASALAAIHAAGLVHRDLKPANVMLTLSGCRVIDFGIARSQDSGGVTAATGKVLGTPGWMAPEVLRGGPATPAADIFAWGCLIAHAGTGRMPFGGDPAALRVTDAAPDLSGLPEPLLPAVRSALSPDPADRPSASDLLLRLVEQPQAGDWPAAPPNGAPAAVSSSPPGGTRYRGTRSRTTPPDGPQGKASHRSRAEDAASTDTRAFNPMGIAGTLSINRTRLLAAAGAAAGTVLVGAVILGLTQAKGDPHGHASTPVRPTASAHATKKARTTAPRPTRRATVRAHTPKQAPKPVTKHKAKHAKGKGKGKQH